MSFPFGTFGLWLVVACVLVNFAFAFWCVRKVQDHTLQYMRITDDFTRSCIGTISTLHGHVVKDLRRRKTNRGRRPYNLRKRSHYLDGTVN